MTLATEDVGAAAQVASPPRPKTAGRHTQVAWVEGAIELRKTGVRLKIDLDLVSELALWALYLAVLGAATVLARLRRRTGLKIWYAPERGGPWYLLRGAALWAGFGLARTPSEGAAAFYFDDTTRGGAPFVSGRRVFNGRCTDISKSYVAEVFAEVFGYPLRVDPERSAGEIVEKAEKNGVHDGRIVRAPLRPRQGSVYQRLVDTTDDDGLAHDLRTPCVGGVPVVVWEKTKPVGRRFAIHNRRAVLRDPAAVFSNAELDSITAFTARMGLDWGGLDILRDRTDGRIYIVDVNKTDLGPVIALSWRDKILSMNRLSRALSNMIQSGAGS